MTFGKYFSNIRRENGQTLRDFCKENGFDAHIISLIEQDLLSPHPDMSIINTYIEALNVKRYSDEYYEFIKLAKEVIISTEDFFESISQKYYIKYKEYREKEEECKNLSKELNSIKENLQRLKYGDENIWKTMKII